MSWWVNVIADRGNYADWCFILVIVVAHQMKLVGSDSFSVDYSNDLYSCI